METLNTIKGAGAHLAALRCPGCRSPLEKQADEYMCRNCSRSFPVIDGIPALVGNSSSYDSYDSASYERLLAMEKSHFWQVGRRELILDVMRRQVPGLPGCRMLEVGCGNGSVLDFLKRNHIDIEGCDLFIEGLRYCRQRAGSIPLYQADVLSLPFKEEYDIVGLFDVLEHVNDDVRALTEINRALKPGGNLILTVPAYRFLWSPQDETAHHQRRYSKKEIVAKIRQGGFEVEKVTYFMFLLFPVLASFRLIGSLFRNREVRKEGGANSLEFRTLPVINELFLALLRLEKHLIRCVYLPFGASLIVVARKVREV